jgi:hypothetical protein
MFFQGFLFALGFGVGCLVLSLVFAITVLLVEKFFLHIRSIKNIDGTVDIRRWQEGKLSRELEHENPRSTG